MPKPHLVIVRSSSMAGRRLKFGEPMVRREFKLPESLSERLTRVALENGDDASDYARKGIRAHLDSLEGQEESNVKDAVLEAFEEIISKRLTVEMGTEQRAQVDNVAKKLGFLATNDLLKDLLVRTVEDPEGAREFLLAKIPSRLQSETTPQKKAA